MRVLDLFAGVGGLSYGFYKNQHFKVIAANEILTDMAKAYSLNHQDVLMFNKDIKDFGLQDFDKDPNIDIVIGGPLVRLIQLWKKGYWMIQEENYFKNILEY